MNLFVKIFGSYDGKASLDAAKKDVQELDQATDKASKGGLSGITKALTDMGKIAGGIVIAQGVMQLPGLFSSMVGSASDLSESASKVSVVFGDAKQGVFDFASDAAKNLGMTEGAALAAVGTFGNLFTALGLPRQAAADLSKDVLTLATDLGSFNNLGTEEVLEKLRAGLTGEAEPLKSLGIAMNATTVQAKALSMGFKEVNGAFTEGDLIQARYAIIMEQTAAAQGDFARTSDGLANQTKILKAQLGDLSADVGALLLPMITALVSQFVTVLPVLIEIGTELGTNLAGAAMVAWEAVQPLIDLLISLGAMTWEGIQDFAGIAKELGELSLEKLTAGFLVIKQFAEAEIAPRLVEVAGAINQIVNARIDQVAPQFDRVRTSIASIDTNTFVSGFNAVRDAAAPAIAVLQPLADRVLKALSDGYRDVSEALKPLGPAFKDLGEALRPLEPLLKPIGMILGTVLVAAIGATLIALEGLINLIAGTLTITIQAFILVIKGITLEINAVTTVVTEWAPAIGRALGNVGNTIKANVEEFIRLIKSIGTAIADPGELLRGIGKSIALGLLNGLKDGFNSVKDEVSSWGGAIKSLKGPIEVDRVLLMDEGIAIAQGLLDGLTKGSEELPALLRGLSGEIQENMEADATQIISWVNGLGDDVRMAMAGVIKSIDWKQYGKTLFEDMSVGNTIPDWMINGTNDPGAHGVNDGRVTTSITPEQGAALAQVVTQYIGGGQFAQYGLPTGEGRKVGDHVPGIGTWDGEKWQQYHGATYAPPSGSGGWTGGPGINVNIQALDAEGVRRVIPEVARQLQVHTRQTGIVLSGA